MTCLESVTAGLPVYMVPEHMLPTSYLLELALSSFHAGLCNGALSAFGETRSLF